MTAIWHRGPCIAEVVSEDEGRVALLNLSDRRPIVLSGSAAVIWSLIDGRRTEREILAELHQLYAGEDSAEMPAQLTSFLAALELQGLAEGRA